MLIDALRYGSYRYNRERTPDVAPHEWAVIFPDWQQLEARYQRERAAA